ncbi:hypothetical protein C0J52_06444 [Blattella germanica]|nr:hypothetical protein C0J52_06444 [Blattella germanica]
MMGQVLRVHEEVLEDRKIGDTVHVVGQLCDFRNERQINASHFNVVDMNYETERIFEVIKVYDNYGKGIKK